MVGAPKYAVIGDPVSQSLSPLIHTAWMKDHGIDATYEAAHVPGCGDDVTPVREALDRLAREGYIGLNVTAPHKELAGRAAVRQTPLAERLKAANTLKLSESGWTADNTDAEGFEVALQRFLEGEPVGNVVLIGAGGAARAVVVILGRVARQVTVVNRTLARAQDICDTFLDGKGEALALESLFEALFQADLVVNTVSSGHSGEGFDWPEGRGRGLIDISYGKAAEVNLAPARQAGWHTSDGLPMLVGQAVAAFEIWFGIRPDFEAGLARACAAVEGRTT